MAQASRPHPWAYVHGGNFAFRRVDALDVGGFDEAYDGCWGYEDVDFAYRLVQHTSAPVDYDPGLVTYHVEMPDEAPDPSRLEEMLNKVSNRNWHRITGRIPGFADFKKAEYARISDRISI